MIIFKGKEYELFFSNKLAPLMALNYVDKLFFNEFERLCSKRYRILSIIKKGWQEKYILKEDIEILKKHFNEKLSDYEWAKNLLNEYKEKSKELREFLKTNPKDLQLIRNKSACLDAMSNMLHLFSSLIGGEFILRLSKYSKNNDLINQNFLYYTQPIKESRLAKLIDIENKFKLNKEDENFSKILRIGSYIKDDVSELLDLRKVEGEVNYFQIGEEFSEELLKKRKEITVLYYKKDKLEVYEGEEAKEFIKDIKEVEINKSKQLHGQVASLGIVEGKVKVVNNSEEALKIEEGDILVAKYTAVEYLPAMKKAIGIITETGGITSHAALVSRELGIPCVVGVKDVTKILKDGQKIKLDGDKGIINIHI